MMSVSAAVVVSGCELVGSGSMTFLVSDWDSSSLQPLFLHFYLLPLLFPKFAKAAAIFWGARGKEKTN